MLRKPPTSSLRRDARRYRFDIKRMTADCEANYVRLGRLLPGLTDVVLEDGEAKASWVAGDSRELQVNQGPSLAQAKFHVQELCRYTTVVGLQLAFDALAALPEAGVVRLQVRLYHDVRLAEVVAMSGKRSALASYDYPNEAMFSPDEKEQQNRFLAEWLSKCLRYGHENERFTDAAGA